MKEIVLQEECPFKPELSPNWRVIAQNKNRSPVHNKLYVLAATNAKRKEEFIKEEFDADPQIIHNKYYWNAKNKDDIKSGVSMDPNLLIVKEIVKKPEMNLSQEFIEYFQELFEILDNNHDGLISRSNIDLSKLDSRVLDVISEVLNHIDKNQNAFQFNDFLEICCKYNVPDRIAEVINLIF